MYTCKICIFKQFNLANHSHLHLTGEVIAGVYIYRDLMCMPIAQIIRLIIIAKQTYVKGLS